MNRRLRYGFSGALLLLILLLCAPVYAYADEDQEEYPLTYFFDSRVEKRSAEDEYWEGNYISLNEDGSGIFIYDRAALRITWDQDQSAFSFTDHLGREFTGTRTASEITGDYGGCSWSFYRTLEAPPSYYLSPDTWNSSLPYVVDEADVLTDQEEAAFTQKAQTLTGQYDVGVYLFFIGNLDDYTWEGSIETLSEELRAGYDLGVGSTQAKSDRVQVSHPGFHDSIILLIAVNDRYYDVCVSGDYGDWAVTTYARESIVNAFLDDIGDDNWADGAEHYLSQAESVLKAAAKGSPMSAAGSPMNRMISIVLPIILALVFGFGTSSTMKASMQNTSRASTAAAYVNSSKTTFTRRQDRYIRTIVTRVYSPKEKSSSGGGHSSSGSSHSSGSF